MATIGNQPLQANILSNAIFSGNGQAITNTFTVLAGQNVMAIGTITHSTGVVTIDPGAVWKVL